MIRRLAGLPAQSAVGDIEIIDVGHFPLDTMLSIVATPTASGWVVSYACAMSPHCSGSADHAAQTYSLSQASSTEVDQMLEAMRQGKEPNIQHAQSTIVGGNLLVLINYKGFQKDYRRAGVWSGTLVRLEDLLKAGDR